MRTIFFLLFCTFSLPAIAQTSPTDTNAKATMTMAEGESLVKSRQYIFAIDAFRKANKQDGSHCQPCITRAIDTALLIADYKSAEQSARMLFEMANTDAEKGAAHSSLGVVLLRKGEANHKDDVLSTAESEFRTSLALRPNDARTIAALGMALAYLKQDEAAKTQFVEYLKYLSPKSVEYQRVSRYVERPELARERMAPPFRVTTMDGKAVTLDSLAGKVVLLDFWATWCGPCRQALPQIQKIAKKYEGEPFVVLSVSLDSDEAKWQEFVDKHEMTWLQYRDGGFNGTIAKLFAVNAIPHTFTIDADGVLQDEQIGDGSIEGKLKKQIARAKQLQANATTAKVQ